MDILIHRRSQIQDGAERAGAGGSGLPAQGERRPPTAAADRPLLRLEVELRSGAELGSVVGTDVIISPDGSRLVFVATDSDAVSHLYTRNLQQSNVQLPGTDGARAPFFSPDGQWVGFWAAGKLKKAPIGGGVPIVLCEAADLLGASWGEDGNIIATLNSSARLWRIPAAGGAPVALVNPPAGIDRQVYPQVLPGAKAVLFTAIGSRGPDAGNIDLYSFADRTRKTLVRGGAFGRYLPNGRLVYINQGTLFAVPFDPERRLVRGTPVAVLPDVDYSPVFGFAQFDFSQTGIAVYRRTTASGEVTVEWLDRHGHLEPILSKPGPYLWPRLSPQGDRLALTRVDSGGPVVVIVDLRAHDRVTPIPGEVAGAGAIWSPDGRFVLSGCDAGLEWAPADGSGSWKPLLHNAGVQAPWSFTPDGKRLAYYQMSPYTHFDLWTVPFQITFGGEPGAGTPQPFLQTRAIETYPAFSPDGRWLSYASNQSGSFEVYVRAFPDTGTAVQVSKGGGRSSHWTASGRELFYGTDDQRIMITRYRVQSGIFQADPPKLFSETRLADKGVLSNFDAAPDGKRVVALLPASGGEPQAQNHVTFLLNFFDEVRRVSSKP